MKRVLGYFLLVVILPVSHALAALTVSPGSLSLESGQTATLTLSGGSGFYNITSSDTTTVSVYFAGDIVTVEAIAKGSADITIQDGTDTVTVPVVVDPSMSVSATTIQLLEGNSQTLAISNGVAPYTVTATPMATAAVSGNYLVITGTSKGSATVTVTDSVAASVVIDVVIYLPMEVDPATANVAVSISGTITVSEGVAPYTAVSADDTIATVSVSGGTVTVDGKNKGNTTITISDNALTPNTYIMDVSVDTFNTTVKELYLNIGDSDAFDILGAGYYNVSVSPANIVDAVISGNSVQVTSLAAGTATITVSDSNGESVDVTVTVYAAMSLSASDITMNDGDAEDIQVIGGVTPYTIAVSTSGVVDVPATWYSVLAIPVTALAAGTTVVTVTDTSGSSASMNVTILPTGLGIGVPKVAVAPGKSASVTIFGGTGYYTLISNDPTIADAGLGTDVMTVTGVATGKTSITVQDSGNDSLDLEVITLLPAPVLNLTTMGKTVSISWNAVSGADGYNIYYAPPNIKGDADTGNIVQVDLGNILSLAVDLNTGDNYFVAIQATSSLDPDLNSLISNIAEFTIQ